MAMVHSSYDDIASLIRSEISKYYDGEFRNTDHLIHDLGILSDDISAIALTLEKRLGIKLDRAEYREIRNVDDWAKALQEGL